MVKLQDKFRTLGTQLKTELIERDAVIEGMICAALAGEHVLLLGPPGTAKSALANAFCGAVDGSKFFEWLLTRFTSPDELYGPISLKALENDQIRRATADKLPECHVCFLDEIFKANSAILNTLLTAINERKFHNNGSATAIPLRFVVGASNELPDGPELAALYDRFLCRYWVQPIQSPDAFVKMLGNHDPKATIVLSLEEWDAARLEVAAITFSEEAARTMFKLRTQLKTDNVEASDRRWKRCVKLLQANAWMSGDAEVIDDHFAVLSDALWSEPEQQGTVATKVAQIAASVVLEAIKVRDTILGAVKDLPLTPSTPEEQKQLVEAARECNRAINRLKKLEETAKSDSQRAKVRREREAVEGALGPVKQATREALGL